MTTSDPAADAGFRGAILARPDDDTARWVYADYLEDHGDPARAEFIRLQLEVAGFGVRCNGHCAAKLCRQCFIRARTRELVLAHGERWMGSWEGYTARVYTVGADDDPVCVWAVGGVTPDPSFSLAWPEVGGGVVALFHRGFVADVSLDPFLFCDGRCPHCGGGGIAGRHRLGTCPGCRGKGSVPPFTVGSLARHPIRDVLFDPGLPIPLRGAMAWNWWRSRRDMANRHSSILPSALFDELTPVNGWPGRNVAGYDTSKMALADLDVATRRLLEARSPAMPCRACEGGGCRDCDGKGYVLMGVLA